jgi:hypothetical protein
MTSGGPSGSLSNSATSYTHLRTVPRFSFAAAAELTDSASTMHLSGRIAEISRKGCYVDILNPLPPGTLLNVQIPRDKGTFVTKGMIIYAHERIGMGVVFLNPPQDQMKILDSWLDELGPASVL